ncbi:MAG: hypothetical protein II453_11490 [Alphaproteobacteria bacterium]|nr:hypothetical protein [Alphaproteobacteria bacterium]
MRTQLKINGELKDVEIENGEITIVEPEKKATGWERAKPGEWQRYIDSYNIKSSTENCLEEDDALYQKANYFTSQELAENISRMQTLQRRMFRWQAENDVNFETRMDSKKYAISNDSLNGIRACEIYVDAGFLPYFSSKEKAKECIEVFKHELIWLFTEFRWRMDD